MEFPKKQREKLKERERDNAFRSLQVLPKGVDFSSNDYLGFASSKEIFTKTHKFLVERNVIKNGATGSRLISGNYSLYNEVENFLTEIHNSETALLFNSGYDANVGFFSSFPQKGDVVLYDEFIHASIRDGLALNTAKNYKFKHSDLSHLEELLVKFSGQGNSVFVVTESVFSMDGDSPNFPELIHLINKHKALLIVDEAHALGVLGDDYLGLVSPQQVFAKIVTFGKGLGSHGAAILCSELVKDYLVNFSRSFIYTTGLPPHSLANIKIAYQELTLSKEPQKLLRNISVFKSEVERLSLTHLFLESDYAIQSCLISGNKKVSGISDKLQNHNFWVKPIKSPTVPQGKERIRFCLHSFNSHQEITEVLTLLSTFVKD